MWSDIDFFGSVTYGFIHSEDVLVSINLAMGWDVTILAIMERELCNVLNQIKGNSDILNNVKIRNTDFFKKF